MPERYTRTAITLHWLVAVLIVGTLAVGWLMTDLPVSPVRVRIYNYHKWLGVTVLMMAIIRGLWRLAHSPPPLLSMPAWQRLGAHGLHVTLYILMFSQPLTGWIYSNAAGYQIIYLRLIQLPNLVERSKPAADAFRQIHGVLAWALAILVTLHILAALKHHLIDRDATLRRMLGRTTG
jgi:cytochrome b561